MRLEMQLELKSNVIADYLVASSVIDYDNENIKELAEYINKEKLDETDLVKAVFEYVRDDIYHSSDIQGKHVTCRASDVLRYREGFCYAKSHLLAALLRYHGIPAGFCYQRLTVNKDTAPYIALHGLNGVYISSAKKWIRLDARGNKEGVDAQFSPDNEKLAFAPHPEAGEEDILVVYDEPDKNVVSSLNAYHNVDDLLKNLPVDLALR